MELRRSSRTKFFLALPLVAAALAAQTAAAQEAQKPRSITVVGVGRESGTPDTAQLFFAVEHIAPTAQAASQEAAKSATQVIAALRKEVGEGGRVDTGGYGLSPIYSREPERPADSGARPHEPVIVGYTATNQVAVETSKIDDVGTMIDGAIAAGAARVNGLSFTIRDSAPLQARALRAASEDAAAQAAVVAKALNVRLTDVIEAATEGPAMPMPQRFAGMAMMAEAAMRTPIEPGEVTTEVRLRVTYGIE